MSLAQIPSHLEHGRCVMIRPGCTWQLCW